MWAVLAIIAGMMNAAALEVNKTYKFQGLTLVFWRSCASTLMLLPFLFLMEWPQNAVFYMSVLIMAIASVIGLMVQFNLASKHNGRVANLSQPISIIGTFIIWLALDQAEQLRFISDFWYAAGVFISFGLMIGALQFIRKNDTSWEAFLAIAPIGLLYAASTVLTKLMLDEGTGALAISLTWVFIGNIMMAFTALPVLMSQKIGDKNKAFMPKRILEASFLSGILHTASWVMFNYAMILSINPSYPTLVIALTPIWFALYYKCRGIQDNVSPFAGMVLAFSAILLMIVTL